MYKLDSSHWLKLEHSAFQPMRPLKFITGILKSKHLVTSLACARLLDIFLFDICQLVRLEFCKRSRRHDDLLSNLSPVLKLHNWCDTNARVLIWVYDAASESNLLEDKKGNVNDSLEAE